MLVEESIQDEHQRRDVEYLDVGGNFRCGRGKVTVGTCGMLDAWDGLSVTRAAETR